MQTHLFCDTLSCMWVPTFRRYLLSQSSGYSMESDCYFVVGLPKYRYLFVVGLPKYRYLLWQVFRNIGTFLWQVFRNIDTFLWQILRNIGTFCGSSSEIQVPFCGRSSEIQAPFYKSSLLYYRILNLLNPTGHVMHQQFNIQQLYALPILYVCVLYLSENKQRLVPLAA